MDKARALSFVVRAVAWVTQLGYAHALGFWVGHPKFSGDDIAKDMMEALRTGRLVRRYKRLQLERDLRTIALLYRKPLLERLM